MLESNAMARSAILGDRLGTSAMIGSTRFLAIGFAKIWTRVHRGQTFRCLKDREDRMPSSKTAAKFVKHVCLWIEDVCSYKHCSVGKRTARQVTERT